jgi:hypothetical protein
VNLQEALAKITETEQELANLRRNRAAVQRRKNLRLDLNLYREDYNTLVDGVRSETFLLHPNSLIALCQLPRSVDKMFQYEAITNDTIIDPNGDTKHTTILLTKNWVKDNFDADFLALVVNENQSQGFVNFLDIRENFTYETLATARQFHEEFKVNNHGARKRIQKAYNHDQGTMYILSLKVVVEFPPNEEEVRKKNWLIKSIGKGNFRNQRMLKRAMEGDDWLDIDEGLVMHDDCIGHQCADQLLDEVLDQRRAILTAPTFQAEESSVKLTSNIEDFDTRRPDQLPCYTLGEKQIASLRYDPKTERFWGKVITAVIKNRKSYCAELVPTTWVQANLSPEFINTIKTHAHKFIWIPAGNARDASDYPYEYDETFPKIHYLQGESNTCASSSLASCLHSINLHSAAEHVNNFGIDYLKCQENDPSKLMQKLVESLYSGFVGSKYKIEKLNPDTFDVYSSESKSVVHLIQLVGSDGGIGHAVTIFNGKIFDSNLEYAVALEKKNLDYCIGAVYVGIGLGYGFYERKRPKSTSAKSRRRHKHVHKTETKTDD